MAPSPPPAGLRLPDASDCELSDLSSATGMAVASASIVTASSERARARRPETAGNESLVMVRWLFTLVAHKRLAWRRAAASFAGNSRAGRACPTRLTGTSEGTGAAQISCRFRCARAWRGGQEAQRQQGIILIQSCAVFPAEIISLVAFHELPIARGVGRWHARARDLRALRSLRCRIATATATSSATSRRLQTSA